jgi:hypothetical protein
MLSPSPRPDHRLAPHWVHLTRLHSATPTHHPSSNIQPGIATLIGLSNLDRYCISTSCEYAESCLHFSISVHSTHEAGQRRMMRAEKEHASSGPISSQQLGTIIAPRATPPLPDMGLTFLPRPQPRPKKRSRAAADIDGEHSCIQKKKRRLRLFLITSRLSPQFSHPATNIVDRGSSKIAVWAKQKSIGRNLLRKAAILNHIRRRAVSAKEAGIGPGQVLIEQEKEQNELALAKLEFTHGSVDTYTRPVMVQKSSVPPAVAVRSGGRFVVSGSPTGSPNSSRSPSPTSSSPSPGGASDDQISHYRSPNEDYAYPLPRAQVPRRDYQPLPPSPLGISNYDDLDADEDIPDHYSRFDEEDEDLSMHVFFEDDDSDSVPFSPSAITSASSSTMQTRASQGLNTPLPTVHAEANILGHSEPVFGDYDQIDDGADTPWPSGLLKEVTTSTTGSTSPNFSPLFATPPSKRADSFATSPNFRPTMPTNLTPHDFRSTLPQTPMSPNMTASTHAPTPTSPNFPAISLPSYPSPNFTPSTASSTTVPAFEAPSTSPNLITTAISPNLPALDAPTDPGNPSTQRRMLMQGYQKPDRRTDSSSNTELERQRQRDLTFTEFGL